jgi:hypothetical protein
MSLITFLFSSAALTACLSCHLASAFITSTSSRNANFRTIIDRHQHAVFVLPDDRPSQDGEAKQFKDDQDETDSLLTKRTTPAGGGGVVPDGRYDVSKLVGSADDGAGFNQFDPVLKVTGFVSRRFGIFGGLALVAALAAVEGREILQSLGETDSDDAPVENRETVTTASGLRITEVRVGKSGSVPLPGYIIGIRAVVSIGDQVIYNTGDDKPIAFKLGQRPFQNVICEGVEEGIQGMKVGGKRVLQVPKNLAPPGVILPPGIPLVYEVELTEVLSGYF